MSSNPSSSSVHIRTTTEETSITPSHNFRKGFPFACSCGGEINLASVSDQTFSGRLCFVCEYTYDGGDHLEKMFDEAVREEIQWTQNRVVDHEDRLSVLESNIRPEQSVDISREITKIYAMVKSLREDLELLDLRYWAVYEKCTGIPEDGVSRIRKAVTLFTKPGIIAGGLSVILGVFLGYTCQRWGFQMINGHRG